MSDRAECSQVKVEIEKKPKLDYSIRSVLNRDVFNHRKDLLSYERNLIEKRWYNVVRNPKDLSACPLGYYSCIDIDGLENNYLVKGSSHGDITFVDITDELNPVVTDSYKYESDFSCTNADFIQFGPTMETFVFSSADGCIRLYDVTMNYPIEEIDINRNLRSSAIAFDFNRRNPKKPLLAYVGREDVHISFCDFRAGKSMAHIKHKTAMSAICWQPGDHDLIAVGDNAGMLSLYSLKHTKKPLLSAKTFYSPVLGIRFTDDGIYMILIDGSLCIRIFNAINLELQGMFTITGRHKMNHPERFLRNISVTNEGKFLKIAIPNKDSCLFIIIHELAIEPLYQIFTIDAGVRAIHCCTFRSRFQQVVTSGITSVLWNGNLTEEQSKTSVQHLYVDEWSDEEDNLRT